MCVCTCAYEEGVNQTDASDNHLSTNKLSGKMEIEFCVSSTASSLTLYEYIYLCAQEVVCACVRVCCASVNVCALICTGG